MNVRSFLFSVCIANLMAYVRLSKMVFDHMFVRLDICSLPPCRKSSTFQLGSTFSHRRQPLTRFTRYTTPVIANMPRMLDVTA